MASPARPVRLDRPRVDISPPHDDQDEIEERAPRRHSLSLRSLRSRSGSRMRSKSTSRPTGATSQASPPLPPMPPKSTSAHGRLEDLVRVPTVEEPIPPPWPKRQYCRCYCEENSYLLAQRLETAIEERLGNRKVDVDGWKWQVWVVFVSNRDKKVLLWEQRASNAPNLKNPVVWDYHVFPIVSATRPRRPRQTSPMNLAVPSAADADRMSIKSSPGEHKKSRFFSRKSFTGSRSKAAAMLESEIDLFPLPPLPGTEGAIATPPPPQARTSDWRGWVYDADSWLCNPDPRDRTPPEPVPFPSYVKHTFVEHFRADRVPPEYLPLFRLAPAPAFLDNFASNRSHMLSSNETSEPDSEGDQRQLPITSYAAPPPEWEPIVGPRAKRKGWQDNLMTSWVTMDAGAISPSLPVSPRGSTADSSRLRAHRSPEMQVQFGQVLAPHVFFAGRWDMPEWKRRAVVAASLATGSAAQTKASNGGRARAVSTDVSSDRPRATEHQLPRPGTSQDTTLPGSSASLSPPVEARRGGRVRSQLFPAYMHASHQARADRKRDSLVGIGIAVTPGVGTRPNAD